MFSGDDASRQESILCFLHQTATGLCLPDLQSYRWDHKLHSPSTQVTLMHLAETDHSIVMKVMQQVVASD